MGGAGSTKTTEYEKKDPWAPQQPYIKKAFSQAEQIYNQRQKNYYNGDFVASYDPQDVSGIQDVRNWANTTGQGLVDTQAQGGQDLFSRGSAALGEVDTGLKDFTNKDWTGQHIEDAGRYANNPFMEQMISAATQDARRTFNEDTVRGINQNAAAGGNTNSTRAGIAAGVAQRGLADFTGNTSATMRGDAWNNGLQMSQADQASLLQSLMGRGDLAQGMTTQGGQMMNDALSNESGLLGLKSSVGELLKANEQSKLDNSMQKFEYNDTRRQNLLNDYYNTVGDKMWGSEGYSISKQKQQASAMSTAGSIIGMLGSLFKSDVRTKNLIDRVGYTQDGLPLYRFTYKDAPHMGVLVAPLAQDVQAKFPEAVQEINGVLYIDTSKYDWR